MASERLYAGRVISFWRTNRQEGENADYTLDIKSETAYMKANSGEKFAIATAVEMPLLT